MIKIGQFLEGTIRLNNSGSAYLVSNNLSKDIYIHKKNTNKALHLDTVKIKVIKGHGRELEGVVEEIIKRFKLEFVGTIQHKNGKYKFIPDSNKMPVVLDISKSKTLNALDGQKVIAKLTDWKKRNPEGQVIKVLGNAGDNDTEVHSILHEYDLPYDFNADIIAEAEAINQLPPDTNRLDLTHLNTFTIDPEDAKDFDDALSVEYINGNIRVGVHIADVSYYVRPETLLDKEAYKRGTSIYLVDRVIPMLPEILSNDLCSLKPHVNRLAFSAIFTLDRQGNVLDETFAKSIIQSKHRYTYEEAQLVIENGPRGSESDSVLSELNFIAKQLRKKRTKDGSMTFDTHEIKFRLDENKKPIEVLFKTVKDSNKLIEEFMLLANKRVAAVLKKNEFPAVNRVHEEPSPEKLLDLKNFIKQFGYTININSVEEITSSLNKLLIDVQDKPEANMIENLVIRTMQKAYYTTKDIGHYGLGFDDYSHFTSPIRRYPDVLVHRLLSRFLDHKEAPKTDKLEKKCQYLSECEKKAQKAERDSIKYNQCLYMQNHLYKTYRGIVTNITDFAVFVEILENKCDGMIKISNTNYKADPSNYCIKSFDKIIRLGDEIDITVIQVDLEKKTIEFSLEV